MKDFVILRVSWLTDRYRTEKDREVYIGMLFYLAKFLQDNNLSMRKLVESIDDVGNDFEIHSKDINEQGMALLKVAMDNWMDKIDAGMSPSDITYLQRKLKTITG